MAKKGDVLVNKEFGVTSQHAGRCNTDEVGLKFLIEKFGIQSMVDIGCGLGGQTVIAQKLGIHAIGIDGDPTIPNFPGLVRHDYNTGPLVINPVGLGWCSAFVEHIHEKYMPNFIETFKCCKYVIMTYAPPKLGGRHHVNCKESPYWMHVMDMAGFDFDLDTTNEIRKISQQKWIPPYGLFFIRR